MTSFSLNISFAGHICRVCVHEECYGLEATKKKNHKWECWACQSVGKEIEGHTSHHKLKTIMQKERPLECALCSVADGVHAMHALYHDHGPDGRQVILPPYRKIPLRLAWVHTLCALSVCTHRGTTGSVYGCDINGDWEGEQSVHHFVMCGLNKNKKEDEEWIKMLTEHRTLSCTICGHNEKTAGRDFRVPLQCCAGDEDEFMEFKKHHMNIGEPCTQAMHVGCAMWGTKGHPPQHRRMWFYPGSVDEHGDESEPVSEIFCDLHARLMGASMHSIKKKVADANSGGAVLQYAQDVGQEPTSAQLPTYTSPSIERRASSYLHSAGGTQSGKEHIAECTSTLKSTPKVFSLSKATKIMLPRRESDVSKAAKAIKSKPAASSSKVKALPQISAVGSIPRKEHATSETMKSSSSSRSSGTVGTTQTIARKDPVPHRGKFTSSPPTAMHGANHIVPSHIQKRETDGAIPHISKRSGSFVHKSTDGAKPSHPSAKRSSGFSACTTSPGTPLANKDTLDKAVNSTAKPVTITSSTSLMQTPTKHGAQSNSFMTADNDASAAQNQPDGPTDSANPVTTASSTSFKKSSPEENLSNQAKDAGADVPFITPPPLKWRRIRSISEEKETENHDGVHMDDLDDVRCNITNKRNQDDDDIWMDDDAQGVLDSDEPEQENTTPQGENPWAYLWEPNAPAFEIVIESCAERRNFKGMMKSLFSE